MATRLYLSNDQASVINPNFESWGNVDGALRRKLLTAKEAGEAQTLGTRHGWTAGQNKLDRQFVSKPMDASIAFVASTVKLQLACREFANGDNSVPRMALKIVNRVGDTVQTTLLSIANYGTTTEFINNVSLRNVIFASNDVVVGTYVTVDGDRLVLEIGFADSSGASPEAQARYGANSGTADHGENDTETTSLVGWFESSLNITFQEEAVSILPNTLLLMGVG